jgi:hypothetical protein
MIGDVQGVCGNQLLYVNFSVIAHAYMLEPAIAGHVTAEVARRGGGDLHAARHAVRQLVGGVDLLEEHVRVPFGADGKGHEAASEW